MTQRRSLLTTDAGFVPSEPATPARLGMLAAAGVLVAGCAQLDAEGEAGALASADAARPEQATTAPSVDALSEAELASFEMPYRLIEGEPIFTVLEKDGIPALDLPEFVGADEAEAFMDPEETVLGVVGRNGTAKCYSAWQLDGHEIVNDELDGEAIAATW